MIETLIDPHSDDVAELPVAHLSLVHPEILTPEELDEDIETKGRRRMAERLREPELQAMSRAVRAIDEIFASVKDSVRRRLEKRAIAAGRESAPLDVSPDRADLRQKMEGYGEDGADISVIPGQTHRDLTPYLAGIVRVERGQALVNESIDRLTERESNEFKARILAGENHVHELIIGSGAHAQVYVAERLFHDPDHPSLMAEASSTMGGQFAYETEVHELNTKTGAESADPYENIAGRSGNKNSLGRGALTDSDLHYDAYSSQDKLATAIRVNETLAGRALVDAEFVEARLNPFSKTGQERYIVKLIDPKTGQIFEVTTDRLISAGGLGREVAHFNDAESQRIVDEELAKYSRGEDSQLLTLGRFQHQTIDRVRRNQLPFEGMKQVAVIGAGDSGSTVVEQLLGYGGDSGWTTRQETHIQAHWVGLESKDEQNFASRFRHRYTKMAADMTPEGMDPSEYFHRINPIDGRAVALKRTADGKIEITYGIYDRNEDGSNVIEDGEKQFSGYTSIVVDHVIMTTGFEQNFFESACGRLGNQLVQDPEQISAQFSQTIETTGSHIFFNPSSRYQEFVVDTIQSDEASGQASLHYHLISKDGQVLHGRIANYKTGQQLPPFLQSLQEEGIAAMEIASNGGHLETDYVRDETGEQIAAQYQGHEVYRIGPQAFMPKTAEVPEWIKESPGARSRRRRGNGQQINHRVALWTTVPATRDFAKHIHNIDHPTADLLTPERPTPKTEPVLLPELAEDSQAAAQTFGFDSAKIEVGIPIHSTKEDMLKLAVSELGQKYQFPLTLPAIELELTLGSDPSKPEVSIATGANLLATPEYQSMLADLLNDQLVQTVTWQFLENTPSRQARLVMPLRQGQPRLRNVRLEEV